LLAPCVRILQAAPSGLRVRAREQLERIASAERSWRQVVEEEGIKVEFMMVASVLPMALRSGLPPQVREHLPTADANLLSTRLLALDGWPDLKRAFAELAAAADLRDAPERKEAMGKTSHRLKLSINSMPSIAVRDYEEHYQAHLAAHQSLLKL